jgi:L-gulonate 5-dehydrogenase
MQAVVFDAPRAVRVEDREAPRPCPGEVLVRVAAAGLCAGDLYIYQGKNPYVSYPRVGGHEIAGHVAVLGEGVAGPPPGTLVCVEPFIGCGRCYACQVGKPNCCARLQIIGVHREGGFAAAVTAPADRLHPVPEGLPPTLASFAEPVAIGVQACRRGGVAAADGVLVLSCGPIGLATVEVAKARGAEVWATDLSEHRLATAEGLGAKPLAPGDDLLDRVRAMTDGDGMPVVVEVTGSPAAMAATIDLVAPGGSSSWAWSSRERWCRSPASTSPARR